MAQIIVRNLEDDIRDRLRVMAAEHGRSMEEEVREILRAAVLRGSARGGPELGTRIAERFRDIGLEQEIRQLRNQPARPADLDP